MDRSSFHFVLPVPHSYTKQGVSSGLRFQCNTGILVESGAKELHMARYRRVSLMTREALNRMLAEGSSLRVIGRALSRVPSIVSGLPAC